LAFPSLPFSQNNDLKNYSSSHTPIRPSFAGSNDKFFHSISNYSLAGFTSIFISLLITLINLSLFPSQKETLRTYNVATLLMNSVINVNYILKFLDGLVFLFYFSFLFIYLGNIYT
jgi:hypothetical protein